MAERERFEPPVPFRAHLISSPSRTSSRPHQHLITQVNIGKKFSGTPRARASCLTVQAHFRHRAGCGEFFIFIALRVVLRVGIKKAPDHSLVLRIVFSRLVLKELYASFGKRNRNFDSFVPENKIFRPG